MTKIIKCWKLTKYFKTGTTTKPSRSMKICSKTPPSTHNTAIISQQQLPPSPFLLVTIIMLKKS